MHLEHDLFVAASLIPHSGKGLFTKVEIPSGVTIVEYKGVLIDWKESLRRHFESHNGYLLRINPDLFLDGEKAVDTFGRYANDAEGMNKTKELHNNSRYVVKGEKVYIVSTEIIPAGAEILVGYSAEYWERFEENLQFKESEEGS